MASGPRQNKADANGDFHHARDEHPNGWVAEDCRDDRLKPGCVGEVLDADIEVHASKDARRQGTQIVPREDYLHLRLIQENHTMLKMM